MWCEEGRLFARHASLCSVASSHRVPGSIVTQVPTCRIPIHRGHLVHDDRHIGMVQAAAYKPLKGQRPPRRSSLSLALHHLPTDRCMKAPVADFDLHCSAGNVSVAKELQAFVLKGYSDSGVLPLTKATMQAFMVQNPGGIKVCSHCHIRYRLLGFSVDGSLPPASTSHCQAQPSLKNASVIRCKTECIGQCGFPVMNRTIDRVPRMHTSCCLVFTG